MQQTRFFGKLVPLAIFTLLYFAAGKLGLRLALVNPSASAVWPPTGIAIAGLLVLGWRAWPALLLGAFLVNITTAGTGATSLGIAAGNTLEALAAAWLVNRYANGRLAFERAQDVFKFALFAGMFSTAISATVGVTSLVLGGLAAWTDFGSIWRTWWLGDAGGALVIAPLLITWAVSPHMAWERRKMLEFGAALLTLLVAAAAVFGEWFAGKGYPLLFLLLPMLVWISFRFAQRETAMALFVLSCVAIAGTRRGLGPFSLQTHNESLLFLQVFLSTIAIMSMTLTAAVSERRRGEQRLEAQQAATRILSEARMLSEALPRILNAMCEKLDWEVGNFWRVAANGAHLEFVETYQQSGAATAEFIAVSKRTTFAPGVGMPGRTWKNQSAVWIDDVVHDTNFPRAPFARRAGLHSAFAFPVTIQGHLWGILEFFTREFRGSKDELLAMATAVASQIAQFAERKQAEEAMKESEALYRTMAETASDAFLTIDESSTILFVNRAAEQTFGYSAAEMIGQKLTMLMPEEMRNAHLNGFARYLRTGSKGIPWRSVELPGRHKNGDVFPLEMSIGEFEANGRRIFTGIARDISARKRAAAELERQKAAAEAANQVKDNFLAMLSHELRTPLSPVISAIDDLEPTLAASPEGRAAIAMIRRNVEHEARLIDDLLDLTRIVKGKLDLRYEILDAHRCIREALDACRSESGRKKIELRTELRAAQYFVHADATKLQQIIWNLVKNAVKFSHDGGVVSIVSENEADRLLAIRVTDRGIGIEPDMLRRIFTPFEQAERSPRRRYGGLGLGLAVSKALTDAHGGTLTATSDGRDMGASFTLTLALAPADAVAATKDRPALPPQKRAGDLRILLVEDHDDTRQSLERLLRRRGYHVESAHDARSALELAGRLPFDLVVSDIGLPDKSGMELMRELQHAQSIKGIAVSGFGMEGDVEKSKAAGFSEHLLKPVNFKDLETAIQNIMSPP